MGWFKLDEGFPRNLKIKRAGRDAALLFVGLLALHQTYGEAGAIPANKGAPEALELELGALGLDHEEIALLLQKLQSVDLVHVKDDGSIALVGLDRTYQNECTTCHGPNDNPRKKTCSICLAKRREARPAKSSAENPQRSAEVPQRSAEAVRNSADSAPEPEPAPECTRPEPEGGLPWIAEGVEILGTAGVRMKPSLRAHLLTRFHASGGGLWDLRRLVRHFAVLGKPGALVEALKAPGRWESALMDCDPVGACGPPGEQTEAIDELTGSLARALGGGSR